MYSMAYSSNMGSRRRSDADAGDYHLFKLIEFPVSPFQSDLGDGDGDGEDEDDEDDEDLDYAGAGAGARRRSCNYGSSRQEYLRSYTFSRHAAKPTLQERVKSRLGRLKAAAWAAVACNPYNLPRRVRRIKDKLALRSARHSLYSSQRSRAPPCRLPLLQPCFRA